MGDVTGSGSLDELEEVIIEGGRGRASWSSLREVWQYREIMMAFAVRRVKVRYKQTAFGVAWAVIQPLVSALLFAVFIGHIARVSSEGVPYFTFALAGMTIWSFFSTTFTISVGSLVADAFILRKVYFPREVLPLSSLISGAVDLVPAFAVVLVATVATTRPPSVVWIALPLPLALAALASVGFGIGFSALQLYYRDVLYVLTFVTQIGMFASPVVYSLSAVPSRWRTWYAVLNPIASAIDELRRILLHGQWPDWRTGGLALAWSALVLALGYLVFKRLERGFADRV